MLFLKRAANMEIAGIRSEICGLALVLIAALWQAQFTDWFDRNNTEWSNYIQEDVNMAILASLHEMALGMSASDPELRKQEADAVADRTAATISKALEERNRRMALRKGQASYFGLVRLILAIAGAGLIIVGKYLAFLHKARAAQPVQA